jgi:AraC-like DNA-binding protein
MHDAAAPAMSPPRTVSNIARLAASRDLEAGIGLEQLLQLANLSAAEISGENARIDVEKQVAFLELVAKALRDDVLGFHLAEHTDLRQAGLLYFVMASSPTLGEALSRAERYSTINNEGIVLRCLHGCSLSVHLSYIGLARHSDRHQIEFWATALIRIARQLTNATLPILQVTFAHPRSLESHHLDKAFGCSVAFGSGEDTVAFTREAKDLPVQGADPYLHDLLVGYCEQALAHRRRPAETLRVRVENAITPLLPHGKARVGDVARALGMSQRTLTRRLAAEAITFAGILDAMRTALAVHYLKTATLSISQVAWLLGFQEVGAFTHAFKRWTSLTPSQFREASRGCL